MAEFKGNKLSFLVVLNKENIQAMAWLWLTALNTIVKEQEDMKICISWKGEGRKEE